MLQNKCVWIRNIFIVAIRTDLLLKKKIKIFGNKRLYDFSLYNHNHRLYHENRFRIKMRKKNRRINNCSGRISAHLSKYYERLTKHHP